MNGFTQYSRPGIFAQRPAPLILNFLGYPGSTGSTFHDYIIGDPVVTPLDHGDFFSEHIIQLPGSFMPIDRKWVNELYPITRFEERLPSLGFVFASFNSHHKITPAVFGVWMKLLQEVANSVLWLQMGSNESCSNLRSAAEAHGISCNRLIFAERVPLGRHHSRHQLADLFLDTFPYNAHSTACFALRAGLPVLTYKGKCFASRVGSSLLMAAHLPELICDSLDAYFDRALAISSKPGAAAALKSKLAARANEVALFNTPEYVRNLENAYSSIVKMRLDGRPTCSLTICTSSLGA